MRGRGSALPAVAGVFIRYRPDSVYLTYSLPAPVRKIAWFFSRFEPQVLHIYCLYITNDGRFRLRQFLSSRKSPAVGGGLAVRL
jgi:hypothetical protein